MTDAYINIRGKDILHYESYRTYAGQFNGSKPLPRKGDRIVDEIQGEYNKTKGHKIDCYIWEVIGILHVMHKRKIEIQCIQMAHKVKWYKP